MATSPACAATTLTLILIISAQCATSLLVPSTPLSLPYHYGPLLSAEGPIELHITFYGDFDPAERSTLLSFLASLSSTSSILDRRSLRSSLTANPAINLASSPTVAKWWSLTRQYHDRSGRHVSQRFEIRSETEDNYSVGNHLRASDMAELAEASLRRHSAALGPNTLALIFTAWDVFVDGFCMHACGSHSFVPNPAADHGTDMVPFAWVGNSKMQCPGFCAWPFAKPAYGPPMEPLRAPNGVGVDGMVIALAKVLAGTATNPFGNAYYQGDEAAFGLEAAGACQGQFGAGAYPGFPGELLTNAKTGASYNMEGADGTLFLVPWLWNPATQACAGNA